MEIGNMGMSGIPALVRQAAARAVCLGWFGLASAGWGQGGWQDLARPWSATLTAFAACSSSSPSSPAVLLAGSRSGRVFRSVDDGKSWAQTPVRMGTDAKGFLDLGGGVILAWAGWNISPLWDCWSLDCGDPTKPGGLFRSTDGGQAWTRVGPEHDITAVARLGASLYAMGRTDLYRSDNRGVTWRKLAQSGMANVGMDRMDGAGNILVGSAYNRYNRIVLSGDTVRWDTVTGAYQAGDFLGKHMGFLFAYGAATGSTTLLMRSLDGKTWQNLSDRRLQQMVASGTRLLGQYNDTLFESADQGITWKASEAGLLEGTLHRFLEADRGRVYLGGSTAKGLLRLDGNQWEWLRTGMQDLPPGPILSTEAEILHADPNLGLATRHYSHTEWVTPRIDNRPLAGGIFGALGKTALASNSLSKTYRTDALDFDRPLGPESWRLGADPGFRAAATGRGWMALFQDGGRIFLCEGEGAIACRDDAIQDLPVETSDIIVRAVVYRNRFRAMAASGDSLAIALDSLYISADRGATFRNLGSLGHYPAWMAFHGGELYAGTQNPLDTAGSNLLRLHARGVLVPHAFPGTGAATAIRGLTTNARGDAYLATSDGVYRWSGVQRAWQDISQGLPSRNVLAITLHDQVCVAALESGQLMATYAFVVGTRPGSRPPGRTHGRAAADSRAPTPLFPAPSGSWRRIDGRRSAGTAR